MNIIDTIRVSGTDYTLSATSSGGASAVEVTQAEYDALVSGGTVDPTVFYIITDAQPVDISNYWTSAQTNSAINAAVSGKVDTSAITSVVTSASTDSEIPTAKAVYDAIPQGGGGGITSGEVQSMIDESVSGKQDTLISGTNIKTINNQSLLGSGNINIQGGGGSSYSAGSGINIDSANTISAVYSGWAGERVQHLENMTSPFYMFKADDCGYQSTFQVSFYINDIQTVVEFDVSTHTYTFIEGDSSWENYVTVEWDTTFGSFKATPNTSINVSDGSCARFSKLYFSGTTENAIDGTLDRIETIKNRAIVNVEFGTRDNENDLYIAPISFDSSYASLFTVNLEGGLKVMGTNNISTQMQVTPYKWMSGVTMWSCETSYFAVPSSSVTFNISRNPNDGLYVKDVNGDSFRIIDSSGNPDSTEYYTTVIDNGYVTVTALYSDRYIKLLGDNSCELDQYVSNLQYWGYETDTIPNVVLRIKDDLSGYVETSAITSSVTSASTDNEIPTAKAVYDAIPQGGGGKAVSGGTNISITTGETADTINCTLPITANTNQRKNDISFGNDIINGSYDYRKLTIGSGNKYKYGNSRTSESILIGTPSSNSSIYNTVNSTNCIGIGGNGLEVGYDNIGGYGSIAIGYDSKSLINKSLAIGYNTVASGTTQTNINNQLTIDTSNQVYIYNKDNTEMICLQDQLGGGGGGGKTIEGGRGITVTSGETADTVSFNLPISATTNGSILIGVSCSANRDKSFAGGQGSVGQGEGSFAFGQYCKAGQWSIAVGNHVEANITSSTAAFGKFNKQNGGFFEPESATTLFSVGNGTSTSARHNAFEIRQNGDIYFYDGTNDVKLQDKFSSLDTTIGNINTILESI